MKIQRDSNEGSDLINVSSLVDVMFILIIFFMATTTFQQEERDAQVNLPDARKGQTLSSAPKVIIINIREDGTYYLGSQRMGLNELQQAVVKAHNEDPQQKVLVRGDTNARHGQVASAVLACYSAGIKQANIGYDLPR